MSDEVDDVPPRPAAPIVYVSDLAFDAFDPADLFDLAYLLRSPDHDLRGVVLSDPNSDGDRILDALGLRANTDIPIARGADGLQAVLRGADAPVNLVVVGGYGAVADVLGRDRQQFRETVARLFVVGGHVNDYAQAGRAGERLSINPRLREQHPERFEPSAPGGTAGEPRARGAEREALGRLLTSGEGVIWLPRDICLWRYSAPGILEDGGPLAEFLLRELFFTNLRDAAPDRDRYDAADAPVLLSSLPAFLLAVHPDPAAFLRLFRALAARVETDRETGLVTSFATSTDRPNLYVVVGIDGQALGKMLTARLRDRPLVTEKR
jgi:hypothetical protein